MRRNLIVLFLAMAAVWFSSTASNAACPATFYQMKDSSGSQFLMSLLTNATDGNCAPNFGVPDGSDVTQGAKADSVCATDTGTCTLIALSKKVAANITTLNTTAGSAVAAGTNRIGYTSDDPCSQKTKTTTAFTTTSGGPVSIVALSGSTVIYICSISAVTDTAIKLSFIDGTGGSCASAQHAIWGSTTAANGMSLPATGGFTMGSGNGSVGVTTSASAFCLLQSGTSLVAGNVTYVQQ